MDRDGSIVTVTLDSPATDSAHCPLMLGALRAVGRELTGDIRVVVLQLDGPEVAPDLAPVLADELSWLASPSVISIASLSQPVRGAALAIALACDLRVLSDQASLSMAGDSGELSFAGIGSLVRLVGPARALELTATGREISAAEAASLGLANVVVPAAAVQAATRQLAEAILGRSRDDVIAVKALINGAGSRSVAQQCEAERAAQASRLCDLADTVE